MLFAGLDGALMAVAIGALAAAALLPLLASLLPRVPALLRVAVPRMLAVLGCLAIALLGALSLTSRVPTTLEWWPGFPAQPFTLAADSLSAPFLLILGLVGGMSFASLDGRVQSTGARALLALQAGFTLAMFGALVAQHALLFLLTWEGMTLLSALLVAHDFRDQISRARRIRAGTSPPTSPPPDHRDAKAQRHPLPSRYVKMGLHREPVVGSLHPVRFADALNLGRHPTLLLEGEQIADDDKRQRQQPACAQALHRPRRDQLAHAL